MNTNEKISVANKNIILTAIIENSIIANDIDKPAIWVNTT